MLLKLLKLKTILRLIQFDFIFHLEYYKCLLLNKTFITLSMENIVVIVKINVFIEIKLKRPEWRNRCRCCRHWHGMAWRLCPQNLKLLVFSAVPIRSATISMIYVLIENVCGRTYKFVKKDAISMGMCVIFCPALLSSVLRAWYFCVLLFVYFGVIRIIRDLWMLTLIEERGS